MARTGVSRMTAPSSVATIEATLADIEATAASPHLAAMARAALFIAAAAYDREESRGGHFRSDFPGPVPTLAHRSRLTVTELRTIVNAVLAGA